MHVLPDPPHGRNGADERFDERAAIAEHDGKLSRSEAQKLAAAELSVAAVPILTAGELVRTYPDRRPAVIDGLLRQGETMNVIAAPKVGKSWLTLGLAFAVATGERWLSSFDTTRARVLIIDNELHPETSAHRLSMMARVLDIAMETIGIDVVNLRGRLQDLHGLGHWLLKIEPGRFGLIIVDAFYRTMPIGTDENDNATMAGMYNLLDHYADALAAAFTLIHHASKGNQSAKAVTDVGAGAGAQSRATDTHLILRPHAEPNAVVLDAAVRSWPPVSPLCLRWDFPVWTPVPDLDPLALRAEKSRQRKAEAQQDQAKLTVPAWTAKRFADAFGKPEPTARAVLLDDGRLAGLSDRKAGDLLKAAIARGYLHEWPAASRSKPVATVKPPENPPMPTETLAMPKPAKPERARKRKRSGKRAK